VAQHQLKEHYRVSPEIYMKLNIKIILSFACVITLLATSGCLVVEGRHGHGEVIGPVVPVPVPVPVPVR